MQLYTIVEPTAPEVPILISSPHSGTYFPPEIKSRIKPGLAARPDDADWFIDKLYDFAPQMGIKMISANYCRWVVDLNRDPQQAPLYNDGRVITGLCPTTDFNGLPLYEGELPNEAEIAQRIENFFKPYHQKIESLLSEMLQKHGVALLFDAHSIRKSVPGISKDPFPDLILGDNDLASASPQVISACYEILKLGSYDVQHNVPFKGGFITRFFGKPQNNVHALQLEMAKTNYMDDLELQYDETRANEMRQLLQKMFTNVIAALQP